MEGNLQAGVQSKGCSNSRPKGGKKYRATVKLVKMKLLWNISPTTRYNWMISPQSLGDTKDFRDDGAFQVRELLQVRSVKFYEWIENDIR